MCNIGAQTVLLNECKWQWLEQVVGCLGQYYSALVFAGGMGPFEPSERMTQVSKPTAFFKVVHLPDQPALGDYSGVNRTFVWIMSNDEEGAYKGSSYQGKLNMTQIEKHTDLHFTALRDSTFPEDCSLLTKLLSEDRLEKCKIKDSHTSFEAGPWYLLQMCAGNTDLTPPKCPNFDR
uniref:DNA/RNA non-specific endonuclease/pyrophosphatase/phosphodiesterase domain-containing protein n=1 Tax=Zooxanthella nutricula TaxID=1333877 RepID=A0A7S2QIM7_9DINO|mmetsp:Transcript_92032/g.281649  ORF Transcript_92032/g.281649 Transcript_92032/m.281649 type:complete len:177 (+) Transcript_92032:267-797(+)